MLSETIENYSLLAKISYYSTWDLLLFFFPLLHRFFLYTYLSLPYILRYKCRANSPPVINNCNDRLVKNVIKMVKLTAKVGMKILKETSSMYSIELGLDASRLRNVGSPLSTSIPYVTSYKNSRVLLFDVWARSHISTSVKELCLLLSILIVGRPLTIFLLLISMQENSLLSSFYKEIYFDKKSDFCGFRTSS